jgi:hypothetical protein
MLYAVRQGDKIRMKKPIKEPMYPFMIRLPRKYVDQAREIAKKELRPFTSVLRRAIIEWLEAYKKRGRK